MIHYLKEILHTPEVIIEDDEEDRDVFPPSTLRLRRSGRCICQYCDSTWGDIIEGLSRMRVCVGCALEIKRKSSEFQVRCKESWPKLFENYQHVLHEIVEIGLHPDRIYQTQMVDTLHLFHPV